FVSGRQVFTPASMTGYIGPVAAGPGGQYFVVNGTVFNSSMVATFSRPGTGLIPSVAPVSNNSYANYSVPTIAGTGAPALQLFNPVTGAATLQINGLEGPLTQVVGGGRSSLGGRTMALDSSTAYIVTVSGLSILPLTPIVASDRPAPNQRGAVNLGS